MIVEISVLVTGRQTPPRIAVGELEGDFAKESGVHIHATCRAQLVPPFSWGNCLKSR
jgi:hypothetical protein